MVCVLMSLAVRNITKHSIKENCSFVTNSATIETIVILWGEDFGRKLDAKDPGKL